MKTQNETNYASRRHQWAQSALLTILCAGAVGLWNEVKSLHDWQVRTEEWRRAHEILAERKIQQVEQLEVRVQRIEDKVAR